MCNSQTSFHMASETKAGYRIGQRFVFIKICGNKRAMLMEGCTGGKLYSAELAMLCVNMFHAALKLDVSFRERERKTHRDPA